MEPQDYKYWAFISYSHQDRAWGNWLHRALEIYRLPRRLVGRAHWSGPLPPRLAPVFRDRDELPSSADLGSVINQALRDSRYLIVICSPQSATSRWVNEEVSHFKALGRADRVLPLIVGGEPNASERPESGLAECLPPAVRFEVSPIGELTNRRTEPIAADARGGKDGRADALLKLIAGMIGVGFDELKQRERRRLLWQRAVNTAAIVALTVAATGLWRWQQIEKKQALEAQALKDRIATLYERGRQELLAHNEARAAVYLSEVYNLGIDTTPLHFMLGRAMRAVDAQLLRVETGSPAMLTDLSSSGDRFFSIGADRHLQVWDSRSAQLLFNIELSAFSAFTARFSPGGSLIWVNAVHQDAPFWRLSVIDARSGSMLAELLPRPIDAEMLPQPISSDDHTVGFVRADGSLIIRDITAKTQLEIPGHYSSFGFCGATKFLMAGTATGELWTLDAHSGRPLHEFSGLHGAVASLDSDNDCRIIAAASDRGMVRVWDSASGDVLMTGGHPQPISDLHLAADGTRLMSQTRGGANIWDGHTGALVHAEKFLDPLSDLAAMSRDGKRLANIVGAHLTITDPSTGSRLYTLDGHIGAARTFNFGAGDNQLISGGSDGTAILWTLPKDILIEHLSDAEQLIEPSQAGAEVPVAYDVTGKVAFLGTTNGHGSLWNVRSSRQLWDRPLHTGPISAAAFDPTGAAIATGGWDRAVHFLSASEGAPIRMFTSASGRIWSLNFSADGRYLAGAVEGGTSQIWDVSTGKPLARFDRDNLDAQAFAPVGATFAVGRAGAVQIWDLQPQHLQWTTKLPGPPGAEIGAITFSPDGSTILASVARNEVYLLDVRDGSIKHHVAIPSASGLFIVAFSPDGRRVALGDSGKSLLILELQTGRVINLAGHTSEIRSVAFSQDGNLVLSGGADGLAMIWDAERGDLLYSLAAHTGALTWSGARFGENASTMLTGGTDGAARLWDLRAESRSAKAIANLLRCRVPWQLDGVSLVPRQFKMVDCSSEQ